MESVPTRQSISKQSARVLESRRRVLTEVRKLDVPSVSLAAAGAPSATTYRPWNQKSYGYLSVQACFSLMYPGGMLPGSTRREFISDGDFSTRQDRFTETD